MNNSTLKKAAQILFGVAFIGQLLFVYFIVKFYWGTALAGNYEKWNEKLHTGFIEGDIGGSFFLMIHIFLAAIITFGGPLQFISPIRNRYPSFHRWNGRIYIVTAFLMSISGLYMVYSHGTLGGNIMAAGNTLNASLIMIFSVLTWRTAVARQFSAHKKWALRAFLVVSGVWFFRIGFGLWIFLNGGSAPGSTEELGGPFDIFLTFAHSLLPLLILEMYFYSKESSHPKIKLAMTGFLGLLSIALGAGVFMAAMIFWF